MNFLGVILPFAFVALCWVIYWIVAIRISKWWFDDWSQQGSLNTVEMLNRVPIVLRVILPFAFVTVCWLIYWFVIVEVSERWLSDWSQRGTFGDMFGAINALFAGLAFAGLLIGNYLQTEQLLLQRQELAHTRQELKEQREQIDLQSKIANQERFENAFFQLLQFQRNVVASLKMYDDQGTYLGEDSFLRLYNEFSNRFSDTTRLSSRQEHLELIDENYEYIYGNHRYSLDYYFANLYNILRLVDRAHVDNKGFYLDLIRSQWSIHETVIIFYNFISDKGMPRINPLIDRYELLRDIPDSCLIYPEHKDVFNWRRWN